MGRVHVTRNPSSSYSMAQYGDIGTSPLYVMSSVFSQVDLTSTALKGVVSSIFWSQTLILVWMMNCVLMIVIDMFSNNPLVPLPNAYLRSSSTASSSSGLMTMAMEGHLPCMPS